MAIFKSLKRFLYFLLILCFVLRAFGILAQQEENSQEDLEELCDLDRVDFECNIVSPQKCAELLEKCKNYYEEKSAQLEQEISETKKKERTYANQVYLLKSKIQKLKNQIYQSNLIIKDLGIQIKDTEYSISKTSLKIEETTKNLIAILRAIYEEDQKSIAEIFLSEDKFSDFFNDLMALEVLSYKNRELLQEIKSLKSSLEKQKESLDKEEEDLRRQVLIKQLQQQQSEEAKKEQEYLLSKVRGEKALYQEYLEEAKKKAEEIRKRIFRLAQIPESQAPTLEEAYELAKYVEKVTGVRPAFLLGLLQIESRIGQNVGQCNCPTCRYPDISWRQVMAKSQHEAFLKITEELGLNPDETPVSCWVGGGKVQMGGAMGPAQFMPSTWLNLGYKKRVEDITLKKPANPWRIKDAFLAAGLYLADWGASSQNPYDEIGAATAYLCGTNKMTTRCIRSGGKAYIYGWTDKEGKHHPGVMDYAAEFQGYIDSGVFESNDY